MHTRASRNNFTSQGINLIKGNLREPDILTKFWKILMVLRTKNFTTCAQVYEHFMRAVAGVAHGTQSAIGSAKH